MLGKPSIEYFIYLKAKFFFNWSNLCPHHDGEGEDGEGEDGEGEEDVQNGFQLLRREYWWWLW